MKTLLTFFTVLMLSILLVSFTVTCVNSESSTSKMPEKVKAAIDKSCFGCHNTASQNAKAKDKLDFTTLGTLSKASQIGKYTEIGEVIKKGEMPPKKFVDNYPDKKLTEEDTKLLIKWAEEEVKNLMKK